METRKSLSGSEIVDEISRLHINSIPESWYKTIRRKNQPNSLAILILWDLLYWYRWSEIRDEKTGMVICYKKKFHADLLQRSYSDIAQKFGISKRLASDTIDFLEELGVIEKVLRTVTLKGIRCSNVLFIKLNPVKIKEISDESNNLPGVEVNVDNEISGDLYTQKRDTSNENAQEVSQNDVYTSREISGDLYTQKRDTNTITSQSNSQLFPNQIHTQNTHTHTCAKENEPQPNFGDLQKDAFELITLHNRDAPINRKIPISLNFISFLQKESRTLIERLRGEPPERILSALKNYVSVADMPDTWQTVFSLNSFLNNFEKYTPEYFDIEVFRERKQDRTGGGGLPDDRIRL